MTFNWTATIIDWAIIPLIALALVWGIVRLVRRSR